MSSTSRESSGRTQGGNFSPAKDPVFQMGGGVVKNPTRYAFCRLETFSFDALVDGLCSFRTGIRTCIIEAQATMLQFKTGFIT